MLLTGLRELSGLTGLMAKMGSMAYMVYILKVYILEVYVVGGVELYISCEGVYCCRSLLSVLSALSSPDGSLPDRQRQKDLLVLYSICFCLFTSVVYSIYIHTYIFCLATYGYIGLSQPDG